MAKTLERRGKVGLPARAQAVVDEFAGVIRRHREQNPADLARLAHVAFDLSLGARESRQAKLALGLARGREARQQLAEAQGGRGRWPVGWRPANNLPTRKAEACPRTRRPACWASPRRRC